LENFQQNSFSIATWRIKDISPMKIAASFFSVFIGWLVGCAILLFLQVDGNWEQNTGNLPFVLFWPLLFTVLGWLFFVVPSVLKFDENSKYFRLPYSILYGSLIALIAYLCLTFLILNVFALSFWVSYFVFIPIIIGSITGLLYPLLHNFLRMKFFLKFHPILLILLFLLPILFVSIPILAFPSFEGKHPELAYRYGTPEMRNRIGIMFMKQVKVGDKFEDLHRKMPFLFKEPVDYQTGGFSGFDYVLEMKNGVVTKFEIKTNSP
jgi:hypothetical protein